LGDTAMFWESIRQRAEAVLEMRGQLGGVSRLCPAKGVADDVTKLVVTSRDGRRVAVLRISPAAFPEAVAGDAEAAERVRELLGDELGRVILSPLLTGEVNGRVFAMLPYCGPLSGSRLGWAMQRRWLGPTILNWLGRMTAATLREASEDQVETDFRLPLEFTAANERLGEPIRQEASKALRLLSQGLWQPRYVLAHNDLWKDNILLRRGMLSFGRSSGEFGAFAVIDWGASMLKGHAIYDLMRLGQSLRLSQRRARAELHRHCQILGTNVAGAKAYLLAALGHLGMHLDQFPVASYVACAEACCGMLFGMESTDGGH